MELVEAPELTRERLVDLDGPRLVLRDDRRVLHALDGDVQLLLDDVGARLEIDDVRLRDERSAGVGPLEVQVGERVGDVRVRLVAKVGARVAALLEQLVRVVEEMHELLRRGLVALLLEERPGVLVEGDAVDGVPLHLERVLVRARGAVEIVHGRRLVLHEPAGPVELVELPVADLPPDLGDVLRVRARKERRLRDALAIGGVRIEERDVRPPLQPQRLLVVVNAAPLRPVRLVVVLRERDDRVGVGLLRVGRRRVGEVVVADEGAPDLLRLVDPVRVVVRVTQEVIDGRELAVLRKLADHALVQIDGRAQGLGKIFRLGVARALLVERGEPVHRVRGRLGLGARARVLRDELLEPQNRHVTRLLELRPLDGDVVVEARQDLLLLLLVVQADDLRDRVAVVGRALRVDLGLDLERGERRELLGRRRRRGRRGLSRDRVDLRRRHGRGREPVRGRGRSGGGARRRRAGGCGGACRARGGRGVQAAGRGSGLGRRRGSRARGSTGGSARGRTRRLRLDRDGQPEGERAREAEGDKQVEGALRHGVLAQ